MHVLAMRMVLAEITDERLICLRFFGNLDVTTCLVAWARFIVAVAVSSVCLALLSSQSCSLGGMGVLCIVEWTSRSLG